MEEKEMRAKRTKKKIKRSEIEALSYKNAGRRGKMINITIAAVCALLCIH